MRGSSPIITKFRPNINLILQLKYLKCLYFMRSIITTITGYLPPVMRCSVYQEFKATVDTRNKVLHHSRGYNKVFGIIYNNGILHI
jgi:hypothetical protein